MDLHLSGKVAIVTGASRGIGRAIAKTLATEGMKLALVARSGDQLEDLAASLPTECVVYTDDLREPDTPAAVVARTVAHFSRLDVLVNNAGATQRGDFLSLSDIAWSDGFALKFFGTMRCCRAAWPHLQASQGVIINIVGVGGRTGSAEFAIGGAVNAALLNLTKVLADRGVKDGVRVNAINPGSIATERLQTRLVRFAAEQGLDQAEASQRMAQALGVARFGEPAEIGHAVAFLASPQAAYCQGVIHAGGCEPHHPAGPAVLGAKSRPPFRERQELLPAWLPNSEPFVLPDATHLPHVENPRGIAESLAAFFARHPLSASP